MSIEAGIVKVCLADGVVNDLIRGRMYPGQAPQSVGPPLVVQELTDVQRHKTLKRPGGTGLARAELTITAQANSSADAKAIRDAVRQALFGTPDNPKAFPTAWGPHRVQGAYAELDADDVPPPIHGGERGQNAAALTLTVWYEE